MSHIHTRLAQLLSASFLRFFAASLAGLVFDVALAATLNRLVGLALITSAAVSLVTAAALMYLVHEFWTFRSSERRFSFARMAGTVISALVALAVRSGILYATSRLAGLGDNWVLFQLLLATGTSFIVNYVIVRRVVGGGVNRSASDTQPPREDDPCAVR
ncbi:GtrA family protein [Afifella marina]|uniref:Putative flippase GtrA (Transmembrane translocase of bactoprenol-linked glucose) n=1 Tax=Afifella marina DSM 2698 TaxID=1120955 RepID=A0A1G5MMG2_AFIMA|nr:GtrA family protein [Afifella marina]SCZ26395.1 Putative flippase GtrA (transmembrane translocase of bactoprenol-linked glucose) [Afifella marina DSM 2698]